MFYLFKISQYVRINSILIAVLLLSIIARAQPSHTLRIDPLNARGGTFSQFFEEVSFIPLETTKESTFGILQKLQISEHYFTFFDVSTKSIFIFNKNGNFRSKITELPSLNKESASHFSSLAHFVLHNNSENVYVVYDEENKLHTKHLAVFNADGKLLQSKQLNSSFNSLSESFIFLDSTKTLFAMENKERSSQNYFSIVENFDTIITNTLSINRSDPFAKSWIKKYDLKSSSSEGSLWSRLFDNKVYYFDKNGISSSFNFLLPANLSLDTEFYTDSSIIGNKNRSYEYLSDHRDKVSYLTNLYKTKDIIAFTFVKFQMSSPWDSYLYNSTSNNLYCTGRISPDSLCYFLPIFTIGGIVVGADEDNVYVSVPSFVMFNTIKNSLNKLWQSNPVLYTYVTTQNPKSNPVLLRLKLKKNL
ncbi:MAG: 6-bladed beta-propeller [Sediminibacterium sp.]|nr:6-bladed beta-propeller [Sediminibacterium sp.]